MTIERLTILDYSDREFLLVCRDVVDDDGWFESQSVADQLGLKSKRLASSRLSWLRRYEVVEREIERDHTGAIKATRDGRVVHTQRWRLTALGEALALGKLRKKDEQTFASMDEGQMLLAARWISQQSRGETGVSRMLQREWRHGHGRY